MSEQFIKKPVRYDAEGERLEYPDGSTFVDIYTDTKTGEYIATCINQHTALLAVAEAADKYSQRVESGQSDDVDSWNELLAALVAWRERG